MGGRSSSKSKSTHNLTGERQGQMALPFLFISFGNHQLPDHPAIEE
jgi:hypothetical protein